MIPEQLAICRQRGHETGALNFDSRKWSQCQWCGMWVRKIETIEEREDEPPINEQSIFASRGKKTS